MPIAVILRRLFLISLLTLPQVYWLGRAWRISAHPRVKRFTDISLPGRFPFETGHQTIRELVGTPSNPLSFDIQ